METVRCGHMSCHFQEDSYTECGEWSSGIWKCSLYYQLHCKKSSCLLWVLWDCRNGYYLKWSHSHLFFEGGYLCFTHFPQEIDTIRYVQSCYHWYLLELVGIFHLMSFCTMQSETHVQSAPNSISGTVRQILDWTGTCWSTTLIASTPGWFETSEKRVWYLLFANVRNFRTYLGILDNIVLPPCAVMSGTCILPYI